MSIIRITKVATVFLLTLLLFACAGTGSAIDGADTKIYIMTDWHASRVIASAMEVEIDIDDVQPLAAPQIGYTGEVQWGVDKDTVTLLARRAIGQDQADNEVKGYVFEVRYSGTDSELGAPTINRLLDDVDKDARQLGQEASFLRFVEPELKP